MFCSSSPNPQPSPLVCRSQDQQGGSRWSGERAESHVRSSPTYRACFLLEGEPATSILHEFSLDVISQYFPAYPAEIRARLRSSDPGITQPPHCRPGRSPQPNPQLAGCADGWQDPAEYGASVASVQLQVTGWA
jgi:hypothetical protein